MTVLVVLIAVWLAFNAAVVLGGMVYGNRRQAATRSAGPWQTSPAQDADRW
jgi:ABC-type iron transport system FetAB permease component